jgi:predicted small lipoprotein YifL
MKSCWAQYLLWLVIIMLGTGSALSACGQKGDLYLPDAHPVKKAPSANKEPSADKEPSS